MGPTMKMRSILFPVCGVTLGLLIMVASVAADYFKCVESGSCSGPALVDSTSCLQGRDYHININDPGSSVVVLSIHGGRIEAKTSQIAQALADRYSWSHYGFQGHGQAACLDGLSNYRRLHITSSHFDETNAIALVGSRSHSVAIHGYSSRRGYPTGTICVGGRNSAQRAAFIDYIEQNRSVFGEYELIPVDATKAGTGESCDGLSGRSRRNIVNKNASGMGLQIELHKTMRYDLVDPEPEYDALRELFYGAVHHAITNG
jgi:phage replication-related protein YjqB (UPF0714/DUF867 family)